MSRAQNAHGVADVAHNSASTVASRAAAAAAASDDGHTAASGAGSALAFSADAQSDDRAALTDVARALLASDSHFATTAQSIRGLVDGATKQTLVTPHSYETAMKQVKQLLDTLTQQTRSNPTTVQIIVPGASAAAGEEQKQAPSSDRVLTFRNWTQRSDGSYDVDDHRFRQPHIAQSHSMAATVALPASVQAAAAASSPAPSVSLRQPVAPVVLNMPDSDDEEDAAMAAVSPILEEQKESEVAQSRPVAAFMPHLLVETAILPPLTFSSLHQPSPFVRSSLPAIVLTAGANSRPSTPATPTISRPTPAALVGPSRNWLCPEPGCLKLNVAFDSPTRYDRHWRKHHTMDFVCLDATCSLCLKSKGRKPATFGSASDLQKHRTWAGRPKNTTSPTQCGAASAAVTAAAGAHPTDVASPLASSLTSPLLLPRGVASQLRADDSMVEEEDWNDHTPGAVSALFSGATLAAAAASSAAAIAPSAAAILCSTTAELPVPLMAPQLSQVDEGDEDAGDDATSATASESGVAPSALVQATPLVISPTSSLQADPLVQANLSATGANAVSSLSGTLASAPATPIASSSNMDPSDGGVVEAVQQTPSSSTVSSSNSAATSTVVHVGVRCDGCLQEPIVGIRFRCADCPRFNLCERCDRTNNMHTPDHLLVKMRKAADSEPMPVAASASSTPAFLAAQVSAPTSAAAAAPAPSTVPSEAAHKPVTTPNFPPQTAAVSHPPVPSVSVPSASTPDATASMPAPGAVASTKPAPTLHAPAVTARPTTPPVKPARVPFGGGPSAASGTGAPVTPPSPKEVKRQMARKSRAELGDGVPRPASATPLQSTSKLPPAAKPVTPVPSGQTGAAATAKSPLLRPKQGASSAAPVVDSDEHKLADAHQEATQPKDVPAADTAISALNQHAAQNLPSAPMVPVATQTVPTATVPDVAASAFAPVAAASASPARPAVTAVPVSPPLGLSFATLPPFQSRKQRNEEQKAQNATEGLPTGAEPVGSPPRVSAAAAAPAAALPSQAMKIGATTAGTSEDDLRASPQAMQQGATKEADPQSNPHGEALRVTEPAVAAQPVKKSRKRDETSPSNNRVSLDPANEQIATAASKRARTSGTEARVAASASTDGMHDEQAAATMTADGAADDRAPAAVATAAELAAETDLPASVAATASPQMKAESAGKPAAPPSLALPPATPPSASKRLAASAPSSAGSVFEDAIDLTADDSPDVRGLRPRRESAKPKRPVVRGRSKIHAKRAAAAASEPDASDAAIDEEERAQLRLAIAASLKSPQASRSSSPSAAASAARPSAPTDPASAAASAAPSSPASRPAAAAGASASKANNKLSGKRKSASEADAPEEESKEQQAAAPRTPAKRTPNRAARPSSATAAARSPAAAAAASASSPPLASAASKSHRHKKPRVASDEVEEEKDSDDLLAQLTKDATRTNGGGANGKQQSQGPHRDSRPPSPSDDSIEY